MGRKLDPQHPEFRLYRLNHMVDEHLAGRAEAASFAEDPSVTGVPPAAQTTVRCRKCRSGSFRSLPWRGLPLDRRIVATEINELNHEPGDGQSSFGWRRRDMRFVIPMSFTVKEVSQGDQ